MARGVKKKSGGGSKKKTTSSKKKEVIRKESKRAKTYSKKTTKTRSGRRRSSSGSASTSRGISNLSMRLFGVPYQFPEAVDPRVSGISKDIGRNFTENILLEAPICTVIPGVPAFLPTGDKATKMTTAQALLSASAEDLGGLVGGKLTENDMKLYDFKPAYMDYMDYVNVMCRCGAVFLKIEDTTEGLPNGKDSQNAFHTYNWKSYKWNNLATKSIFSRVRKAKITRLKDINDHDSSEETLSSLSKSYGYVQFYIDSEVSPDESLSNTTTASSFKGMLDQGSSMLKEVAFMANTGGIDTKTLQSFTEGVTSAMQGGVSAILGSNGIGSAVSRIINLGSETLKGNNLIIPDIYQNSEYSKSYSFTVHLKTPYGTRFGYYYDIFVPLMHLLALVMPKQQSANSFNSPFLMKAYVNNTFTCNLGIASSISIQKVSDSYSTSGLPSEVDVTIQINDLYSDLMMSSAKHPKMFLSNTSLVEYLATTCGLDLTNPNMDLKWGNLINTYKNSVIDTVANVQNAFNTAGFRLIKSVTDMANPW